MSRKRSQSRRKRNLARLVESQPPVEETGRAHLHLRLALEFCFQFDPRMISNAHPYLNTPKYAECRAAYEQLLQACLADQETRKRLLLYLAAYELEEIGGGEGNYLYQFLSGEEPIPPNDFINEVDILQPHLLEGAKYIYEAVEDDDEPSPVSTDPLDEAISCQIVGVTITEAWDRPGSEGQHERDR